MHYKYFDVINRIKEKIIAGEYKSGCKLPSIQTLSKELSLNSDTILRAYKTLEEEHLIYSVAKSGFYVVKSTNILEKENEVIDMLTTGPLHEVNPYKDFYHCMEKAISLYEHKLFEYSPIKGMPELILALKKHMVNSQVFTKEQNIFITSGAQQALYILCSMDFPNERKKILVEQPTYQLLLEAIHITKTPVIGIERTENGLNLSELESIFSKNEVKFFYLMPRFQNPTGFSYSNNQKKEILRLAKKYNVYIVEDDYLADLELNSKADPLFTLDDHNIVIYVRSFSKTLLPGLRLGMAIIPEQLQEEFIKRKNCIDLSSSVLSQGALEIYLQSSMYDIHVKRTKLYYKEKMDILRRECKREIRDLANCFIPPTGIFAYIELANISAELLITKMLNNGVKAMSINASYINEFTHSEGIRLSICKVDTLEISRAVKVLKHALIN